MSATKPLPEESTRTVATLRDLAALADYSFLNQLERDPNATKDGEDYTPRQVFSGHYVPVKPTPIQDPEYVAHSRRFFRELGFEDSLAESDDFMRMFSGDTASLPAPLERLGWATGYALSIFGTEYIQQCPFQTGNGYGDGRAMSILEAVINGQRWEMQLKGGGRTPYCRGGDGRAVLRSSVREFLAQEHMHALGVPTSRSLSLYVSKTETVQRPWYSEGSRSADPDIMVADPVAISTRVAPSFLRVGQLELFARRARKNEHPEALKELGRLVSHLIQREYSEEIDQTLPMAEQVLLLAELFRGRLTSLVANWIRVGYCQGNFNSDNCAAGGFTLDYGPFGFCELFDPNYQPWTGGGQHFSFFNQPAAAERNFYSFCTAILPLLAPNEEHVNQLNDIYTGFPAAMQAQMENMWAEKLGLRHFNAELISELEALMLETPLDYTMFFRELSSVPSDIEALEMSFYKDAASVSKETNARWSAWLEKWRALISEAGDGSPPRTHEEISRQMKLVNPKYILREWIVRPAYQQAAMGDYSLIRELQDIMAQPYDEQSKDVEEKYYRQKPNELFQIGGVSHYSCSS